MTIPSISGGGPNDTRQSQIVWEWVRTFYEPNLFAKIEFTEGLEIESICLHLYVITFSSAPATAIFLLHERLETCKFSQKMWRFFSETESAKRDFFFDDLVCQHITVLAFLRAGFWYHFMIPCTLWVQVHNWRNINNLLSLVWYQPHSKQISLLLYKPANTCL